MKPSRSLSFPALAQMLALSLFTLPGCGTTSAQQWKETGIDVGQCVAPALAGALGTTLTQLLDAAADNENPDYAQIGQQLAQTYGPTAALCAITSAWRDLNAGAGGNPTLTPPATASTTSPATSATTSASSIAKPATSSPPAHKVRHAIALNWLVHNQHAWTQPTTTPRK